MWLDASPSQPSAHTQDSVVSSQAASRGDGVSNSCLVLLTPSEAGKATASSYGVSQQPDGVWLRALLAPRDTAPAHLSTLLLLSSQAELAQMSLSKEMVLSP